MKNLIVFTFGLLLCTTLIGAGYGPPEKDFNEDVVQISSENDFIDLEIFAEDAVSVDFEKHKDLALPSFTDIELYLENVDWVEWADMEAPGERDKEVAQVKRPPINSSRRNSVNYIRYLCSYSRHSDFTILTSAKNIERAARVHIDPGWRHSSKDITRNSSIFAT